MASPTSFSTYHSFQTTGTGQCLSADHVRVAKRENSLLRPPWHHKAENEISYFSDDDSEVDANSAHLELEPSPYSPCFPDDWDYIMSTIHPSQNTGCSPLFQPDISDIDSEESDTDYESESDSEAQYITIYPDSMWYKPAPHDSSPQHNNRSGVSSTLAPDSRLPLKKSSSGSRLNGLRDQFRRLVSLDESVFDEDCWGRLDSALLSTPARAFEDTCWSSLSSLPSPDGPHKPLPDVPIDFIDEGYDDDAGVWVQNTDSFARHGYQLEGRRHSEQWPLTPLRGKTNQDLLCAFTNSLFSELY